MEYVQQVLVHVLAAKLGDARALFDDLEAHRRELRGLRGFVSMGVSRSSEPGGDTLVSVETRWKDQSALNQYLGSSRTAESVIRGHSGITVSDTLQVRQLEAMDAAGPSKGSILSDRILTSIGLPIVIVGVGLAIIYALSRVFIEMGSNGAVPLAIIIATSILLVAWYFAQNRTAPVWQMGGIGAVAVAALIGGTVWAQTSEGPTIHRDEPHVEESPSPGGAETPGTEPPGNVIELQDNVFVFNGAENPTLTAAAGVDVTLDLVNNGGALHNMHIAPDGFASAFCTATGADPCSDPARVESDETATITFNLPAGTYDYRCDFHTAEMNGTIEVQ